MKEGIETGRSKCPVVRFPFTETHEPACQPALHSVTVKACTSLSVVGPNQNGNVSFAFG